jgi:hypothetical protein
MRLVFDGDSSVAAEANHGENQGGTDDRKRFHDVLYRRRFALIKMELRDCEMDLRWIESKFFDTRFKKIDVFVDAFFEKDR